MKKILLLHLFFFVLEGMAFAQGSRSLQSSWLHLDKPFYVTEDDLGFQLYLAPEFAKESIVIQSILFDATGEPQLYAYWSNQRKSTVPGKMLLPAGLSTGWYYLSFRVWDRERQTERVLLQAPLAVYNDQETIIAETVSQQEPSRQTAPVVIPEKELTINIANLPENALAGGEISLELQITDRRNRPTSAEVSVSVTDWGLMGASMAMGMDNLQQSDSLRVVTPANLIGTTFWQGIHLEEDGRPATAQPLVAMISDREQTINTDTRGRFVWQQPITANRSRMGFLSENDQPVRVRFLPAPGRLALGELFYTPAAFRYLEINRQRKIIKNLLPRKEVPLFIDDYQNDVKPFGGPYQLAGVNPARQLNWAYTPTAASLPASTTIFWSTGNQTTSNGVLDIKYAHPPEATTYRIDVVAQDAEGRRGRTTVYYRVK
ncbi:MAG: hypothetical protein ACRBG0_21965 [Lewinella sp.]|jgi:hypothetical protein|uniref:hypothetical protein n=1 Tax=Lewinella sp. TaxID=2004506 RepID=UPI003D6A0E1F